MTQPIVTLKQVLPGPPPRIASRSAEGTLPTRATRYCQPVTEASGFGYHLCVPINFSVLYDGCDALWTWEGQEDWYNLGVAQFPGFSERFDESAPKGFQSYAPPFLSMGEDPGMLQIWTGVFARTAPGWGLLVRSPVNLDHSRGYEHLEGIIETDRWFGPLFTNIRLRNIGHAIHFVKRHPFIQLQPVHRDTYGERALSSVVIERGLASMSKKDWADFHSTVILPTTCPRQIGAYAVRARKRRAEELRGSVT